MAVAFSVLTGPKAEVETQDYQVRDVSVFLLEEEAAVATMEWTMPNGVDFSRLTRGSLIPYVLSCRVRRLSNPM